MPMKITTAILAGLALISGARAEITITNDAGKSITGEVVRLTGNEGVFLINGQRTSLKLSQLTESSRAEFIEAAKSKGVYAPFPPVRVQAVVGTQQRRATTSSYTKIMEISPRVVIEGVSRLDPVPAAEATMLIVTMDTRAKYVSRKEVYKVHAAETIQIPAAANGERRQIEFAPSEVSFDSWRDKTNVGGSVYKYYVFGLRDPESKLLIDFQTNHPQVAAMCKTTPLKREDFLRLTTGAPFSAELKSE